MKEKLYLDTSIPSAPFDKTKPMRIHITESWFLDIAPQFELFTSTLTIAELNKWTNQEKRCKAFEIIEKYNIKILEINENTLILATEYVEKGAFPSTEIVDAQHLACAVLNDIPNFASWDFKHIVSVNPILKIRAIHEKKNFLIPNIGSLAIFGGDIFGSFEPEKFTKEKKKIYDTPPQ